MNIRIESISVNGLGPIASIKWPFKDINLIYGKNEQGKTYLVEYLLRSLFKNAQSTRNLTDSGQVNISGLINEITRLDPKSRKKIEDYVFSTDGEKPVDLSRLCVVKGGELSFLPHNERAISKSVLKDYLSDQRILDTILGAIPDNIQGSTWEKGQIISKRQAGDVKTQAEKKQRLQKIDELLQEVDEVYALGEVKKLTSELEQIDQAIADQKRARRAFAWSLSEQIKQKKGELQQIRVEDLDEVKNLLVKLESKRETIEGDQAEKMKLEPQCEHYPWLETAIEACEKRPAAFTSRAGLLLAIFSIICTAASIVFAFIGNPYVSLGAGLLAILLIVLATLQYRSMLRSSADSDEVDRIFQEYEEKFGEKARSIAALENTRKTLERIYHKLQNINERLDKDKGELSQEEKDLKSKLSALTGKKVDSDNLEVLINDLQKKRDQLNDLVNKLEIELAKTGVQPGEYISEPVEIPYDPAALEELENRKQERDQSKEEKEEALDTLEKRIRDITADVISSDWDELIDHLRNIREEVSRSAKNLKAAIVSGILIKQVIDEMRLKEDESITRALASPGMSEPIRAITHTYDGVELEDNELIVFNQVHRFPIGNLSTGAQEQVLMALRIGIASYVLKERKMFLILDDAFQHSDWERRVWLVDEMADLANTGWQIIYFSMDDHIKMLFEERIRPKFKDRYQAFELKSLS